MTTLFAGVNDDTVIAWNTIDTNPHYGDWKRGRSQGPFHLCRIVRKVPLTLEKQTRDWALTLLMWELDALAGEHGFVHQTTWPVILHEGKVCIGKMRDIEAAVFKRGEYTVASTLVIPMFKEDLEGA